MPPLDLHRRTPGAAVRRTPVVALGAALVLAVGGCGGGDSSPGASPPSDAPTVTTAVSIGQVAGTVQAKNKARFRQQAAHLRADVGKAVDAWFDGGFVGVSYPTTDFPDAFATFTAQAKSDATKQQNLMTTGSLGAHIDGVTTLKRTVALDVLAPKGKPAGVTARVLLRFKTTGDATKTVTVSGRLFLTQDSGGAWQVFGYDVSKGASR